MKIVLTMLISGIVLTLYALFEKRLSQRPCLECGAKISVDDQQGKCPDCRSLVD